MVNRVGSDGPVQPGAYEPHQAAGQGSSSDTDSFHTAMSSAEDRLPPSSGAGFNGEPAHDPVSGEGATSPSGMSNDSQSIYSNSSSHGGVGSLLDTYYVPSEHDGSSLPDHASHAEAGSSSQVPGAHSSANESNSPAEGEGHQSTFYHDTGSEDGASVHAPSSYASASEGAPAAESEGNHSVFDHASQAEEGGISVPEPAHLHGNEPDQVSEHGESQPGQSNPPPSRVAAWAERHYTFGDHIDKALKPYMVPLTAVAATTTITAAGLAINHYTHGGV